jgi:hypothetical protein
VADRIAAAERHFDERYASLEKMAAERCDRVEKIATEKCDRRKEQLVRAAELFTRLEQSVSERLARLDQSTPGSQARSGDAVVTELAGRLEAVSIDLRDPSTGVAKRVADLEERLGDILARRSPARNGAGRQELDELRADIARLPLTRILEQFRTRGGSWLDDLSSEMVTRNATDLASGKLASDQAATYSIFIPRSIGSGFFWKHQQPDLLLGWGTGNCAIEALLHGPFLSALVDQPRNAWSDLLANFGTASPAARRRAVEKIAAIVRDELAADAEDRLDAGEVASVIVDKMAHRLRHSIEPVCCPAALPQSTR